MATSKSMLVTSEMMQDGMRPVLFIGGAANIQSTTGPIRNPGRDPLAHWLDGQGWLYFDPQIHPSTHGREYQWEIDAPQEKKAREEAQLRVYEVIGTTIGAVTMLEIMDDARRGRRSIVWFNDGEAFAPLGLGSRKDLKHNQAFRQAVGDTAYFHLLAYLDAGSHIRRELPLMLADCSSIVFVTSFQALKETIVALLSKIA